jgi:hypothetical protein
MEYINEKWIARDIEYEAKEITDEEFVTLYESPKTS